MYFLRIKLLFVLAFLLSSCAVQVKSIKEDKDVKLKKKYGYLLLALESSQQLDKIVISGEKNVMLGREDLQSGSHYLLTALPAGEYEFSKIKLNFRYYLKLDEAYWQFKIKPNAINYVGHLELKNRGGISAPSLRLVNRSSEVIGYMEEAFPNLLKTKALTYGGPREDDFFELAKEYIGK